MSWTREDKNHPPEGTLASPDEHTNHAKLLLNNPDIETKPEIAGITPPGHVTFLYSDLIRPSQQGYPDMQHSCSSQEVKYGEKTGQSGRIDLQAQGRFMVRSSEPG
jgi:hypothetical protein